MSKSERETPVLELAGERASRMRQRMRLIDACISALHIYGPSRTTVEKVVNIAKMSPGIVTFYFDTKGAMLVAALEFLANEFEQRVMVPVTALKAEPVRALKLLVDLYLDPDIASPRKVSVWYAFWGEGNSRREYLEICGKKDDTFAALVNDLTGALVREGETPHLDIDGVSLGLIGALEMIWQGFAFQEEASIDRPAAKARCMAYLRSVFPRHFGADAISLSPARVSAAPAADPAAAAFAHERDRLFLASWQFAGHEAELARPGDYVTLGLPGDRGLILRGADGDLRGFRNRCRHRPHAVLLGRAGHAEDGIRCAADGLDYGFDGRLRGATPEISLTPLPVLQSGGLIFISFGAKTPSGQGAPTAKLDLAGLRPRGAPRDTLAAANWKLVMEQWLGRAPPLAEAGVAPEILESGVAWHAADEAAAPARWQRLLLFPNVLIDRYPGGASILQLIPEAPGRSLVRHFEYEDATADGAEEPRRLIAEWLRKTLAIAESAETGLSMPGEDAVLTLTKSDAATAFDAWRIIKAS